MLEIKWQIIKEKIIKPMLENANKWPLAANELGDADVLFRLKASSHHIALLFRRLLTFC